MRPKSQPSSLNPNPEASLKVEAEILALMLISQPPSYDLGLEARIWALRLGFGPQDWDFGLETGIWASGLGFERRSKEKEKEEEKIPHMCGSIGHRTLRGRCPKRGHKKKRNWRSESKEIPKGIRKGKSRGRHVISQFTMMTFG